MKSNTLRKEIIPLLSFVVPGWRTKDRIEPILMEIKLSVVRLRTAIHDLTEFGEGALGNASKADDRNLAIKLRPLVKSLKDADKLVRESADQIEYRGWTSDNLSKIDQRNKLPPDSLDRLLACVQSLVEDVRLLSSFIQGNAPLLFKRISLTAGPETPTSNGSHYSSNSVSSNSNTISSGSSEWVEDYDYVSFESKDLTAKKNLELKAVIPENLHKHFDKVVKIAENSAISGGGDKSSELNSNDKLLVKYYSAQIVTHMGYLNEAIDSFLNTVEKNQPPKFFLHMEILSAHNLVSIGDIVHRNISKTNLKVEVEKCTDELSDTLKDCVLKSKKAAQCFPSVTAVQEMVVLEEIIN
uniref:Uncharacterized protein n=1 Tax=Megaselia scalaris TaxID=36166 RepID=T1GXK4_MEGSC